MTKRAATIVSVWMLAAMTALVLPAAPAVAGDGEDAEDILYMLDGRELHGQILEEKSDAVVFELVDRASGIRTKVTYLLDEIGDIERDVPFVDDAEPRKRTRTPRTEDEGATSKPEKTFGAVETDKLNVPTFYVVPMKGQMGTDVSIDVYREMIDDIEAHKPDYLIIEMECRDEEDRIVNRIEDSEGGFTDIGILENYNEVVALFRDELRDIPQVLWVRDSMGASSIVAFAWPQLFMAPEARLGGIAHARQFFERVADEDVQAKFREAYMAICNGFAERGGYDFDLLHAMVRPEFQLSASWKGRNVDWRLDTKGEYIVDSNEEESVTFRARDAENFCISAGTAENVDDLALLMGIREYRIIEGEGEDIFEDHRESWRRAYENCKTWWGDYNQYLGWAGGDDTMKYLGRAKSTVEKILAAVERYDAVAMRLAKDGGIQRQNLITIIEQLREQIRALRDNRNAGGAGGRGGGRGAAGGR